MSPYAPDREAALEEATMDLFADLGWETVDAYREVHGPDGTLGREHRGEIILTRYLEPALEALNPGLPREAIDQAVEQLVRDRSSMNLAQANRTVYELLREGVPVTYRGEDGVDIDETVRVIDWTDPDANHFLLVSQLWITGELHTRRTDLVGFVNGLPLLFIELKASHKRLKDAYDDNLRDYKDTIPRILWHNALIVLSNGSESRVGTITAAWEHFGEWKKISDEEEPGIVSLETMARGTCERRRFLDLVENFVLYQDAGGALAKILAKNHQYLGVNNAIEEVRNLGENRGRLGVFWHTQGSGKSFSMIFFSRKVLRKIPGNWTFVVVTDRLELDDQIYKNFASVGAVTETEDRIRAQSGRHLQDLLRQNHRHLFTLIQKFQTPDDGPYPELSARDDVVVMTDEAHRTQYDTLAMNMRRALPNAAFLAFTGTPLIAGEEKTREVFGDYVSVYDFKQSVEDRATVPLYYENRIPELQLTNEDFNEEMERILEEAELDAEQEKKLEREFGREHHIITRDQRLDTIAEDLVDHFLGRGHWGKAMFVAIDRATAVRMYDKVRAHWLERIERLRRAALEADGAMADEIERQVEYMRETDMAVVVSQAQNEIADFEEKGVDIRPHRERMMKEDLETKFKDPDDPFRLVFVCSMWMTGFDAPAVSTIYLDKPMRNHTLMQAIARANRVHRDKTAGLIVDYVGVFRNLRKALSIYGAGADGEGKGGETPVANKQELIERLREVAAEVREFMEDRGIDVARLVESAGLERIHYLDTAVRVLAPGDDDLTDDAVEALLGTAESKKAFLSKAQLLRRLHKAILPDPRASEFSGLVGTVATLAEKIRSLSGPVDISGVMDRVEALLDESVAAEEFLIQEPTAGHEERRWLDLGRIDFDKLREHFDSGRKRSQAERLKGLLTRKVVGMVERNRTRMDYMERLQQLIDEYNAGSKNVETFFRELVEFARSLSEEDQRAVAEGLDEESLAVFDLLTKPEIDLTDKEIRAVKAVAHRLLETLKADKLTLDWREKQQNRAAVRLAVAQVLDDLPRAYSKALYEQKCALVFQHIYDAYAGANRSVYNSAA